MDENSSLGATPIVSLLGEGVVSNVPVRGTAPLQTTMADLAEMIPVEKLLSGPDEEKDNLFNLLATCVLDDRDESFCESGDGCDGTNEE